MKLLGANNILTDLRTNLALFDNPPELSSPVNYNQVSFCQLATTLVALSGDPII